MKSAHLGVFIVVLLAYGLVAPSTFGQGALGKTDLGKSQNTTEDLANSLMVNNKPKIGKGEKKEEVDPKKLSSKTIKDPMFQGSLNDMGLDWTSDKIGKSRDVSAADSKSAKQSDAAGEKDAKASKAAETTGAKDSKSSDGEGRQKVATSRSDEKSSDKEKASAETPDGDRR